MQRVFNIIMFFIDEDHVNFGCVQNFFLARGGLAILELMYHTDPDARHALPGAVFHEQITRSWSR